MRKRSLTIFALSLLTGFTALAAAVGTSAWFQEHANLETEFVNGASLGAYFAYGDGTKDNPQLGFSISTTLRETTMMETSMAFIILNQPLT